MPPPSTAAAVAGLIGCDGRWRRVHALVGDPPPRRIEPGFAGLASIVIAQQVSVAGARTIEARLAALCGGLDPAAVAAADEAALRGVGLTGAKARSLRGLAAATLDGRLDPDALAAASDAEVTARLTALPGIGRWSAEIYLLFALDRPDVFPSADLALREAARCTFDLPERPTVEAMAGLAEDWRPWLSVAARLLFAYYAALRSGRIARSSEGQAP